MKIKIGEVELQLDPDHSAKEVYDAKEETKRAWESRTYLEREYYELGRMIMNLFEGSPLDKDQDRVRQYGHEAFKTMLKSFKLQVPTKKSRSRLNEMRGPRPPARTGGAGARSWGSRGPRRETDQNDYPQLHHHL